jgi:glycogen synthase
MAGHKGWDLLAQVIEKYIQNGAQFVAVGRVSGEYDEYARMLNERYPNSVRVWFGYSGHLAKKLYASSDFLFNISSIEPCGLCPLIANKYGSMPIVYYTGGIKDNVTDFKYTNGNGYVYVTDAAVRCALIAVNNCVRYRLAYRTTQIAKLLNRRIKLCRKCRYDGSAHPLVYTFCRKTQLHFVYNSLHFQIPRLS